MRSTYSHTLTLVLTLALSLLLLLASSISVAASAQRYYESAYNTLILEQRDSIKLIYRLENGGIVSAIDTHKLEYQIIPYNRTLFLAELINSNPSEALHIGLGFGAFNHLFNHAYPKGRLTTVEIDPMVVALAKQHAQIVERENNQIVLKDGRRFLRRNTRTWDWIIIDAFVKNGVIPMHLTTREFFTQAKARLSSDGVLVMNLHTDSDLYDAQVKTILDVFPSTLFFHVEDKGNIIAVAPKKYRQDWFQTMRSRKVSAKAALADGGVFLKKLARFYIRPHQLNISDKAQVLTDDFAPVEFLGL